MLYLPIYIAMILMPVSGYLQAVFSATSIEFWGIILPAWGVADARLADSFLTIHGIVAFALAGLLFVHLGLVALNIIKQPQVAAHMLPTTEEGLPKIGRAETTSKIAQNLANDLRLFGWIEFWLQFALAFICGLLLLLAGSGRMFSPGSMAVGDGMRWAVYGFSLLCFALLLAYYYTRVARKVVAIPSLYFDREIKVAFRFLRVGLFIGLLGVFISFTGVSLSISLLVAKIVSQPPGMAITEPNRIIRALDIFILIVNLNLLMAHFIGMGITLWLGIRVAKARLEYMAIPAKSG